MMAAPTAAPIASAGTPSSWNFMVSSPHTPTTTVMNVPRIVDNKCIIGIFYDYSKH